MFNGKKGLEGSIMVAIVILISAVIIILGVKLISDVGNDAVDRESCKASVLLKERSKILGKPLIDDVNCETNLVDVSSTDENEIKKIIANEMYDCWYQFGEGKRDFLDNNDPWKGDNYCFVCSRIDFSEETQGNVAFVELANYLATEQIPTKNQYFFDYFFGEKVNTGYVSDLSISTDTPTYVVFFADKRKDWEASWNPLKTDLRDWTILGGSCLVGAKVGSVTGGLVGSVVPIAGTIAGGTAGALIGCVSGMVIGTTVEEVVEKRGYVSGLYIGNDEKIIEVCQQ